MKTKKRTAADRFIPEFTDKIEQPDFVVYMNSDKKNAIAYIGKSYKKSFYYRFKTVDEMEKYCLDWALETAKRFDKKRELQEKTRNINAADHFSIGEIIYNSWGWEQTNIDFFQITEVTAKKIRVKQIAQKTEETGFMCGNTSPIKDEFLKDGKSYLLSLKFWPNSLEIVAPVSYYSFHKLEEREKLSCSWYA